MRNEVRLQMVHHYGRPPEGMSPLPSRISKLYTILHERNVGTITFSELSRIARENDVASYSTDVSRMVQQLIRLGILDLNPHTIQERRKGKYGKQHSRSYTIIPIRHAEMLREIVQGPLKGVSHWYVFDPSTGSETVRLYFPKEWFGQQS